MKQADVFVGGRYVTRVSGALVVVTVVRATVDYWSKRTAFVVRTDEGRELPKPRHAQALRLTKGAACALACIRMAEAIAKNVEPLWVSPVECVCPVHTGEASPRCMACSIARKVRVAVATNGAAVSS